MRGAARIKLSILSFACATLPSIAVGETVRFPAARDNTANGIAATPLSGTRAADPRTPRR